MESPTATKERPAFMDNPDPQVEQLLDFIMKKCLWQFHSRAWDRTRQNENILAKTTQLLCGETVNVTNPEEKCYWVDAVFLADNYRFRFPWVNTLSKDEIKKVMKGLHEKLEYLTVTGSLNKELTDQHY